MCELFCDWIINFGNFSDGLCRLQDKSRVYSLSKFAMDLTESTVVVCLFFFSLLAVIVLLTTRLKN